jgi:hypothetical protein
LPDFAVLVGNPHAPGTRFIFLVFDKAGLPACIVKAGLSPEARDLVRREHRFLSENSPRFSGLPAPLGFAEESEHTALALPYLAGRSPSADDATQAATLLSTWRTDTDPVPLGALPAWQALDTTDPIFQSLPLDLASLKIHPVLMHGDFAPWNIKVAKDGTWTSLDWERGEFPGIPGWDWFHCIVQWSILVMKETPKKCLLRIGDLIQSDEFKRYARSIGIDSISWELFYVYLCHALFVLKPVKGASQIEDIRAMTAAKLGNPELIAMNEHATRAPLPARCYGCPTDPTPDT